MPNLVPAGRHLNYMVEKCESWLKRLAYKTMPVRHDGEPSLCRVMNKVKHRMQKAGITIHLHKTPRYSSQSLGSVAAMQSLEM